MAADAEVATRQCVPEFMQNFGESDRQGHGRDGTRRSQFTKLRQFRTYGLPLGEQQQRRESDDQQGHGRALPSEQPPTLGIQPVKQPPWVDARKAHGQRIRPYRPPSPSIALSLS